MKDRIAIITGASSGIGRATALRLAEKSVKMVLNGRDQHKLAKVAREISRIEKDTLTTTVCGDVSDVETTASCINACLDTWQELPSIFIASAGRGLPGTVISSNIEEWEELINTNIVGLMYQLRHISKAMLELIAEGRDFLTNPVDIVVIGSSIGRNVSPFNSVYGATKFSVHGLTEALRRELGPKGIRVTLIEPGLVQTNFQKSAGYDEDWFGKYVQEVGPVLTADDIAKVICFLLELPGNVHLDNVSIRPTRQSYP